ncbi:protein kinase [Streptomyces sp. NPDC051322]|uniref:serine/threonine-protein kinase n=1 Tax=Streptomyces sp. NPDC051322 TaxID=3154645 RepID=UPI00344E766A
MRFGQSALTLSRYSAEVLAGRYRLDAVIGSGGAGDVHRGFDLRLKRPVAVKVFRAGADIDMEERFHNEAMILARLQHPGLVTVYDAGRHNGRAYLVMQLIEGPTLKERIAAGPLASGETAALGAGIAQALSHAHEAGVVHRDVKPSNIILDTSGHPHLTDFGISRVLDATTRTATGTLLGTAAYLSPEQVLGQSVGPPADIYALGLVLLECVTGRLEYDGGPLEAAIARLHRRPELPSFLPEELVALLRDMNAMEAGARPPAPDCARTLIALAGTAPCESVPSSAHVTSMVPREAPAQADLTHPLPSHAAGAAAPKSAPARARMAVAGGAVVLAAVVAATVAVSDGVSPQGNGDRTTRATSSPSAKADPPGTPADRNEAGPAAPTSSTRDAVAAQVRDPALDQRSSPASALPSREPVTDRAVPGTAAPPSHSTAGGKPSSRAKGRSDTAMHTKPGTQSHGKRSGKDEKPQKRAGSRESE